jgi:hypothetical protein
MSFCSRRRTRTATKTTFSFFFDDTRMLSAAQRSHRVGQTRVQILTRHPWLPTAQPFTFTCVKCFDFVRSTHLRLHKLCSKPAVKCGLQKALDRAGFRRKHQLWLTGTKTFIKSRLLTKHLGQQLQKL